MVPVEGDSVGNVPGRWCSVEHAQIIIIPTLYTYLQNKRSIESTYGEWSCIGRVHFDGVFTLYNESLRINVICVQRNTYYA